MTNTTILYNHTIPNKGSQVIDSPASTFEGLRYRERDMLNSLINTIDAHNNIAFNLEKREILCCTSLGSKLLLLKLITDNSKDNTGFLMWISNYCFSCISQHNNMKTKAKFLSTIL